MKRTAIILLALLLTGCEGLKFSWDIHNLRSATRAAENDASRAKELAAAIEPHLDGTAQAVTLAAIARDKQLATQNTKTNERAVELSAVRQRIMNKRIIEADVKELEEHEDDALTVKPKAVEQWAHKVDTTELTEGGE